MHVIGLTGSIGMGKSTVAGMLRQRGIAVLDADQEVHRLYAGPAAARIEAAFPGTIVDGQVDRARLAAALGRDTDRFRTLEAIVHPLVRDAEQRFLAEAHGRGDPVAVLEIPLLYETGLDAQVDAVVVVSAPAAVQRQRVLERPGMTGDRLEALLARQLPDAEKRRRADFVVDTGGTLADTDAAVDTILATVKARPAEAFTRHWS